MLTPRDLADGCHAAEPEGGHSEGHAGQGSMRPIVRSAVL